MVENIDENYIAYIKEAQQGKLDCFNGKYILCKKGKIIASGSQESMGSLYKSLNFPDIKAFRVELKYAKSQNLEDLEEILKAKYVA